MKQVISDKYNVAWFKLADCIARGEKERALGIYRLLSHSLEDKALACQLHGDILLSFKDEQSEKMYKQAASMYQEQKRYLQAAAVYEHLVVLYPHDIHYRNTIIELYQQLGIASKVIEYATMLIHGLLEKNEWKKAIEVTQQFTNFEDATFVARLHEKIVLYLLQAPDILPDTIMDHVRGAIDAWHESEQESAIFQLFERITILNKTIGNYAQTYWQKKNNG